MGDHLPNMLKALGSVLRIWMINAESENKAGRGKERETWKRKGNIGRRGKGREKDKGRSLWKQ